MAEGQGLDLSQPIDCLGLSTRALNALDFAHDNRRITIGELVKYSRDDLHGFRNLGRKTSWEIALVLDDNGLALQPCPPRLRRPPRPPRPPRNVVAAALLMREVVCELVYRNRAQWDAEHPNRALGVRTIDAALVATHSHSGLVDLEASELRGEASRVLDRILETVNAPIHPGVDSAGTPKAQGSRESDSANSAEKDG